MEILLVLIFLFLPVILLIVVISKQSTLESSIKFLHSKLDQISESLAERAHPSSSAEEPLSETTGSKESKTDIPIDPVLPEAKKALQDLDPIPEKSISPPPPLPDKEQRELLTPRIKEAS